MSAGQRWLSPTTTTTRHGASEPRNWRPLTGGLGGTVWALDGAESGRQNVLLTRNGRANKLNGLSRRTIGPVDRERATNQCGRMLAYRSGSAQERIYVTRRRRKGGRLVAHFISLPSPRAVWPQEETFRWLAGIYRSAEGIQFKSGSSESTDD